MFDSHLHLATDETLAEGRAVGVRGFLLAGVDAPGWREQALIAAKHPDVFRSAGVHPQVAHAHGIDALEGALNGAVALGEIGLDALNVPETLPRQRVLFRAQLALARERNLPVLLHVLRAHEEVIAILRDDGHAGGVVHSFGGSVELMERYIALGLHVSLGASVTFHNATKVLEVAAKTPRERLLIETDAPPNTPAFLLTVAAAVARCRNETIDEVARFTEGNTRRLLRLS